MTTSLEDAKALGVGLLLGDDSGFSREFRRLFQDAGIQHLTAASGANLGLVAGFVAPWRLNHRWLGEAGLLLAYLGYWVASGGSGSLWRASLMASFLVLSRVLGRKAPAWFTLMVTVSISGVMSSEYYRNYGFWLSAGAIVGLLFSQHIRPCEKHNLILPRWQRLLIGLFFYLLTSTIIASAVAPLVWLFFGRPSMLSAFSTPIAQLFVGPLQVLSVLVFGSELFLRPIAPLAQWCLVWIFDIFVDVVRVVTAFSNFHLFGLFSVGWYGLCLGHIFRVGRSALLQRRRFKDFSDLQI